MRILILTNDDVWFYHLRKELLKRLLAHNEVFIALPASDNIKHLLNLGCIHIETKLSRRGKNPIKDIKLLCNYIKIIKKVNADIVLTYTIKPNVYGGIACRMLKIPCLANVTGLGTSLENRGFVQKIALRLYKFGINKNTHVFFQNQSNMQYFIQKKIVPSANCSLIPGSGVNLEDNPYEEYPSPDEQINFVFIGRIMKDKGVNELFSALKIIKEKHPAITFTVIGPMEEDYSAKISELINNHFINYFGYQKDVHKYIKQAWATILPSYHEGIANVLLESSAAGRPVIASRVTGCIETFEEGVTGIGCNVRDSNDLVNAILSFIRMPYQNKVIMGKKGREKVEREFDRNIVVKAYLAEIDKVKMALYGGLNE